MNGAPPMLAATAVVDWVRACLAPVATAPAGVPSWVRDWVEHQLSAGVTAAASAHPLPAHLRELRPDRWPLLETADIQLSLRRLQPMSATASDRLLSCVRSRCWLAWSDDSRLDLRLHRLLMHPECFVAGARLEDAGHATATTALRVLTSSTAVQVVELGGVGLALELTGPAQHAVGWVFDPNSLQAVALEPADPHAARLVLLLDWLQRTASAEAATLALAVMTHPAYFVRWRALQVLGALGDARFMACLQTAAHDPHPEVAAQAQRSLAAATAGAS